MENVEFELTYAALKMFGKQLYSNVGSAISELVANGIDAGAEEVYVAINVIDKHNATVEILDNGSGMTYDDIKEHYIKIGYNKRKNTATEHNKMLGRKGIGKLAALYLSDCFSIVTKNSHQKQMHWKLDIAGIQDETKPILKNVDSSIPDYLVCKAMWESQEQGTYIFLENVDFDRFGEKGFEALECRLSNFFLYDELGVKISINIVTKKEEIGVFKEIKKIDFTEPFPRMTWADAMKYYGSDKPDLRFGMKFVELMDIMKGHGFSVFDDAAYIGGICAEGAASYTRKQLDQLTEFVKRPQIGAKGMVYARVEADGNVKSSVDKFYSQEVLQQMKEAFSAKPGDLILILSGPDAMKTRKQLCELRLEVGRQLGLRDKNKFACLWVVDFPMFEWSEEEGRLMAMHHPFTHPKEEDIPLLDTDPAAVRADAYDMVVNGVEVGGGSIRIHDSQLQAKMFEILGFTPERAQEQFGFLMNAFKYGAPPHGGLAYGLDRWVSLFAGLDSIRDCIAFPKNNSGRDVMLDAPAALDQSQLDELNLVVDIKEDK